MFRLGNLFSQVNRLCALRKTFQHYAVLAQEQTQALVQLAFLYDLPLSIATERFRSYCAQSIRDWRDCYRECQVFDSPAGGYMRAIESQEGQLLPDKSGSL